MGSEYELNITSKRSTKSSAPAPVASPEITNCRNPGKARRCHSQESSQQREVFLYRYHLLEANLDKQTQDLHVLWHGLCNFVILPSRLSPILGQRTTTWSKWRASKLGGPFMGLLSWADLRGKSPFQSRLQSDATRAAFTDV